MRGFSDGFLFAMKDDTNPVTAAGLEEETVPNQEKLRKWFESRAGARTLIVGDIERRLAKVLAPIVPSPTVKIRTKKFASYYKKYLRQLKSGAEAPHITDLMGVRIVCPFMDDLGQAERLVKEHFDVTEVDRKGGLYSDKEFGYESIHLLINIPEDLARVRGDAGCNVIEIQIRTILQDAWAEVEHEIFYKSEFSPLDSHRRRLYALNANLFLADMIFQDIRSYQKNINNQLKERRENFYQTIELASDAFIPEIAPETAPAPMPAPAAKREPVAASPEDLANKSVDELLLSALTAHNNKQFDETIAIYSLILEQEQDKFIRALIFKHRGLANFAQSKYDEAISDFTAALELDKKSHISVYYRGIVRLVLQQYPKAIDDLTLSLEINPYQHYCLFRRGQAFFHMGDYPKALADCNASLLMEPGNGTVKAFRGMILDKLQM